MRPNVFFFFWPDALEVEALLSCCAFASGWSLKSGNIHCGTRGNISCFCVSHISYPTCSPLPYFCLSDLVSLSSVCFLQPSNIWFLSKSTVSGDVGGIIEWKRLIGGLQKFVSNWYSSLVDKSKCLSSCCWSVSYGQAPWVYIFRNNVESSAFGLCRPTNPD